MTTPDANDSRYKEARLTARKYMEEQTDPKTGKPRLAGLTQFARSIGVGATAFSQFMSGIYPGNNERIASAIMEFHNRNTLREMAGVAHETADIYQTRQSMNFMSATHSLGSIGVLYGTAGVGKSAAVRSYMLENKKTVLMESNPTIRAVSNFLGLLGEKLKVNRTGNIAVTFERIKEHLKQNDYMVVVDDAHELSTQETKNTNIYQIFKNMTIFGIPVMLIGNEDLEKDIWLTSVRNSFQQIISRVRIMEVRDEFTKADVGSVINAVIGRQITDGQMFDFLYKNANLYIGSLRQLVDIVKLAASRANGNKLTLAHLQDATKYKIRELKPRYKNAPKTGEKINVNLGDENGVHQESVHAA